MKNSVAAAIIACTLMSGCSREAETVERVKDAVRAQLKDPSSAQFTNVRTVGDQAALAVCGEVNAKNSFGAYVGPQRFWGTNYGSDGSANAFLMKENERTYCEVTDQATKTVDDELAAKRKARTDRASGPSDAK